MNRALELYENQKKVMHIAGYLPFIDTINESETFFYNETSCWGWGTWKRAWTHFSFDANKLLADIKNNRRLFEFDMDGSYPFSTHLKRNTAGKLVTWAINWHAAVFLNNGLCLHPKQSLVANIGMDNSGINSGTTKVFETTLAGYINVSVQPLHENKSVRKKMEEFYFASGFNAMPESPLTGSTNVSLEKTIESKNIIDRYKKDLGLEVSPYFKGKPYVFLFRCNDTGFRFYYPYGIDGDSLFYGHLQQIEWYYMPWKWEHESVKQRIQLTDKVLEIGCGPASFIEKLTKEKIDCTGLELNKAAVDKARAAGLNVFDEPVQQYSLNHKEEYDIVCSFQVMEHIAQVKDVISASIDCLKSGGKLFISVPNNNSFLGLDEWNILNLPPHHMGLWNRKSLDNLEKVFPIRTDAFLLEPPQPYHKEYSARIVNQFMHEKWVNKFGVAGRVLSKMLRRYNMKIAKHKFPEIQNFTIIAQYTKL
jgi:SAM-dependent methyltransferase